MSPLAPQRYLLRVQEHHFPSMVGGTQSNNFSKELPMPRQQSDPCPGSKDDFVKGGAGFYLKCFQVTRIVSQDSVIATDT